jgi:hypothetical protein
MAQSGHLLLRRKCRFLPEAVRWFEPQLRLELWRKQCDAVS